MTDALRKMVEAMAAEMQRQVEHQPDQWLAVIREKYIQGCATVDLEEVARAGLAALKDPTGELFDQICRGSSPFEWRILIRTILGEQP